MGRTAVDVLAAETLPQPTEFGDRRGVDSVVDPPALAPVEQDAGFSQGSQMIRQARLRDAGSRRQIADATLARAQEVQHPETRLIPERVKVASRRR